MNNHNSFLQKYKTLQNKQCENYFRMNCVTVQDKDKSDDIE